MLLEVQKRNETLCLHQFFLYSTNHQSKIYSVPAPDQADCDVTANDILSIIYFPILLSLCYFQFLLAVVLGQIGDILCVDRYPNLLPKNWSF